MARRSRIIQTESGKSTVRSGERHGDEDDDEAVSRIYILPLNNKCIHDEGLFLNWDHPISGVPVTAQIMAGRAQVGGQGSYGGHSGWNPWGELDFTGRMEIMVESGVSE